MKPYLPNWLGWIFAAIALLITAGASAQAPPANVPGPPHEKAAIITLSGEVNDMMRKSLERRIDLARKAGCTLIIYQMNTYGGLLTSGLEISKLTKKLPGENIHTVAWVNDHAISAGALISFACQQVIMVQNGTVGDCAPIAVSVDNQLVPLPAAERAKLESPLLNEFEDSSVQNGYDKTLLWAMVVTEIEIHEVHNALTGETKFVDTQQKDKLLAEQVDLPGGEKRHPWTFISTVDNANQLLTVNADKALRLGLSKATINNQQELRTALNIRGDLLVLDATWAESVSVDLGHWLTQDSVRAMLFIAMMIFSIIEYTHPGSTVPGVLASVCLILLVGAPFMTGLAQAWEIVLIVLGIAIIATDFFVFGGIGFLAIPGFLLMAIGLVASFVPMEPGRLIPTLPGTMNALWNGLATVVFGSLISLGVFAFMSRYIYMAPGLRKLQLAPAAGGPAIDEPTIRDAADRPANDAVFVGSMGLAVTDLRPAGKARFAEHLIDVVSFGQFIPQNSEVEVLSIDGNRIVVKPRPKPPAVTPAKGDGGPA